MVLKIERNMFPERKIVRETENKKRKEMNKMILKVFVGVVFWIMTLMLGYFIGKEEGRKEGK